MPVCVREILWMCVCMCVCARAPLCMFARAPLCMFARAVLYMRMRKFTRVCVRLSYTTTRVFVCLPALTCTVCVCVTLTCVSDVHYLCQWRTSLTCRIKFFISRRRKTFLLGRINVCDRLPAFPLCPTTFVVCVESFITMHRHASLQRQRGEGRFARLKDRRKLVRSWLG